MSATLSMIGKVLHKDVRLFWPFAGLSAMLFALSQIPPLVQLLGPVGGLVQVAMQFAFVLLILTVVYEDAVVSLRHDWLTRPIPALAMLAAKSSLVLLALVVPSVLGAFAYKLYEGRSFVEALVTGIGNGANGGVLFGVALVMAFASVTVGIRQAFIVFLAIIAVLASAAALLNPMFQQADPVADTPEGWLLLRTLQLVLFVASLVVVWVQYRHRHTRSARTIAAAAVLVCVAVVFSMNWSRATAIQAAIAPESDPAEADAEWTLQPGCFPSRRFDPRLDPIPNEAVADEMRRDENLRPVTFWTQLAGPTPSPARRIVVDHATISWVAGGKQQKRLLHGMKPRRKLAIDSTPGERRTWVLPFADHQRLAATAGIETHVEYSLSVLAPSASAELVVDGERRYYAGLGWCGASMDRTAGTVEVNCYAPGAQPAQLVANVAGAPNEAAVTTGANLDYTPAILDFWGGRGHRMSVPHTGADAPRVTVTAYEPRAHFDKRFVIPGVLGGPASACPAP
jgi:hypothetical protein